MITAPQFGKTCPRYYKYNADGLRISSTIGKFITSYLWDPTSQQVLQEITKRDTTGLVVGKNTYVYGLGLISTTDINGNQRYVFPNALGSVERTVTSSGGSGGGDYKYDVFGNLRSGTISDTFLFARPTV